MARRLIFGNRSVDCREELYPLLSNYAGIWASDRKTVRTNSNRFCSTEQLDQINAAEFFDYFNRSIIPRVELNAFAYLV